MKIIAPLYRLRAFGLASQAGCLALRKGLTYLQRSGILSLKVGEKELSLLE